MIKISAMKRRPGHLRSLRGKTFARAHPQVIGLYKAQAVRRRSWPRRNDMELATLAPAVMPGLLS